MNRWTLDNSTTKVSSTLCEIPPHRSADTSICKLRDTLNRCTPVERALLLHASWRLWCCWWLTPTPPPVLSLLLFFVSLFLSHMFVFGRASKNLQYKFGRFRTNRNTTRPIVTPSTGQSRTGRTWSYSKSYIRVYVQALADLARTNEPFLKTIFVSRFGPTNYRVLAGFYRSSTTCVCSYSKVLPSPPTPVSPFQWFLLRTPQKTVYLHYSSSTRSANDMRIVVLLFPRMFVFKVGWRHIHIYICVWFLAFQTLLNQATQKWIPTSVLATQVDTQDGNVPVRIRGAINCMRIRAPLIRRKQNFLGGLEIAHTMNHRNMPAIRPTKYSICQQPNLSPNDPSTKPFDTIGILGSSLARLERRLCSSFGYQVPVSLPLLV